MMHFNSGLTLDLIAKCAFGISTDAISNPNHPIIKEGRDVFSGILTKNWLDTIMFSLPLHYFPGIVKFLPLFTPAFNNLWNITRDIMKQREDQKITSKDFIDR
jgi:hypothetical protein